MEYFTLPPILADGYEIQIPIYKHTEITSDLLMKAHMVVQVTLHGYRVLRTRERVVPGSVLTTRAFLELIVVSDIMRNPLSGILIYIV